MKRLLALIIALSLVFQVVYAEPPKKPKTIHENDDLLNKIINDTDYNFLNIADFGAYIYYKYDYAGLNPLKHIAYDWTHIKQRCTIALKFTVQNKEVLWFVLLCALLRDVKMLPKLAAVEAEMKTITAQQNSIEKMTKSINMSKLILTPEMIKKMAKLEEKIIEVSKITDLKKAKAGYNYIIKGLKEIEEYLSKFYLPE